MHIVSRMGDKHHLRRVRLVSNSKMPPPDPRAAARERRVQRSIRLPISLWNRFDQLAKESGADVTSLIEQAVRYYFAALDRSRKK